MAIEKCVGRNNYLRLLPASPHKLISGSDRGESGVIKHEFKYTSDLFREQKPNI
jgi:hypothetical protein